jgi:hypothetical protein
VPWENIMVQGLNPREPSSLGAQRLPALFVVGWLLINFALLGIFDRATTLFGLPPLPAALFVAWALLIGVHAAAARLRSGRPGHALQRAGGGRA